MNCKQQASTICGPVTHCLSNRRSSSGQCWFAAGHVNGSCCQCKHTGWHVRRSAFYDGWSKPTTIRRWVRWKLRWLWFQSNAIAKHEQQFIEWQLTIAQRRQSRFLRNHRISPTTITTEPLPISHLATIKATTEAFRKVTTDRTPAISRSNFGLLLFWIPSIFQQRLAP